MTPVVIDRAWHDQQLVDAVAALLAGHDGPALAALAASRFDPHLRELRAEVLGQAGQRSLWALTETAEADPRDPDRWLLVGSAHCAAAWSARGGDRSLPAPAEDPIRMHRMAGHARDMLFHAARLLPHDPVPHSLRLRSLLAVGGTEPERDAAYSAAVERCPDLYGANVARVRSLSPLWYGDQERMLTSARAVAAGPGPAVLAAVLMVAHVEGLMVAAGGAAGTRTLRAAKYLVGATMNDELVAVSDRVLADPDTHPRSRSVHQVLAFVLHFCDEPRARRHLALAGTAPAVYPWANLGEPAAEFAEVRAKLGLPKV